jgi:hypothetical protein
VNVEDPPQAPVLSGAPASPDPEPNPEGVAQAAAFGYAEIAAQSKRIVWPCCILGGVVLVALALLKQPFAGLGVCIGLALGMVNARLLQISVLRRFQSASGQAVKGGAFLASGLVRLGGITCVAVVLALIERPLGIGVVVGLAVYQILLLGASAVVMYRQVRA